MLRILACLFIVGAVSIARGGEFQAGAAVVDVTPEKLPVLVNGGMLSRTVGEVKTPVNARALVLGDGKTRVALVVVDSCMVGRALIDDAKEVIVDQTGIPHDHILISATHTHTAPSSMGCLGTDTDEAYVPYLRKKLAEVVKQAVENLEPARVGWGSVDAGEYTALRRWIRRPDRLAEDPFGNPTVRANMHAGRNWDDVTGESGPEDPQLSVISVQSTEGRPIAVLANFSMHYFGDSKISADYFGLFCEELKDRLAGQSNESAPPFVGIMSHGCSGDIWRRDYTIPADQQPPEMTIEQYASALVDRAEQALKGIQYDEDPTLAMREVRLTMKYRVPDKQRLEWAQRIVEEMGDRIPKDVREVYAREQVYLHEWQSTEVVVQAVRIGEIGIASTPCETYALTGLKIKAASPFEKTMVIELANGGDGYIPPPEQHLLGGYNTWAARSAGLEVQAEPRITAAAIHLLEQVAGAPRRDARLPHGPLAKTTLQMEPAAYWRLNESAGPRAEDSSPNGRDAIYEPGVVFYLAGPNSDALCGPGVVNRAAHFAGGRLRTPVGSSAGDGSVSLWIWNGMPRDAREIAGWILSRGHDLTDPQSGEHLGLVGRGEDAGKLVLQAGGERAVGKTVIDRWTWAHVVVVREGDRLRVYVNGSVEPEIELKSPAATASTAETLFVGGRCDNVDNWEGRLDEVVLFSRALSASEISALSGASPKE